MRPNRPSQTAAWVAALRGLDALLPPSARLVKDPYGLEFGQSAVATLARAAARAPGPASRVLRLIPPLQRLLLWMQVRTRVLDEEVIHFTALGGRQVVLLGAGYDCRAVRLGEVLSASTVVEVDHPATQARKREVLEGRAAQGAPVRYLAWDFEARPMAQLPEALRSLGHDATQPTLTLWEGVSNYLSAQAIEDTFAAVRGWSAEGSRMAFTYFDQRGLFSAQHGGGLEGRVVSLVGEPFRSGFDPAQLGGWLGTRGFSLEKDHSDTELCRTWLPATGAAQAATGTRHIAVAVKGPTRV